MKKLKISLLIIIILFLSIGTIYANDNTTADINDSVVSYSNQHSINEANSNTSVVKNNLNYKSFKDLQDLIDTNSNNTIDINDDYKFNPAVDSNNGIKIINRNLTINGNSHIIDGDYKTLIFNITNSTVTINDLTLENGNSSKTLYVGGAINANGDKLTINNCNFTNNVAKTVGGAIVSESKLTIINNSNFEYNTIDFNDFSHKAGAVYTKNPLIVNNSEFSLNDANNGEGGAIYSDDDINLNNCNFTFNFASNYGAVKGKNINATNSMFNGNFNTGPGTLDGDNIKVDNCDFIDNSAKIGAGICGDNVFVNNSRFINNSGYSNTNFLGSGIYANNLNVSNSLFDGNAVNYRGGAILVNNVTNINNCTFINNTARKNGGAVSGTNININNSRFIDNYAISYGGAVSGVNVTINNSNLTDNYGKNDTSIFTISNYSINNSSNTNDILSINLTKITYSTYKGLINYSNGYYGYCTEPYSSTGGEGYAIDDLSYITNINDGKDVSEYIKIFIWYYYENKNPEPSLGGYFESQYIAEFTHRNFYSSKHPPIQKIVELYDSGFRVPSHNAIKKLDNGSYMVFNFKTFLTTKGNQNTIMFNVSYLDKLDTHMKVEKITETKIVNLGNKTSFIIRVTNDCDYILHNVSVIEDKWDDGLIYDSWKNNDKWTYSFINNKNTWNYNSDLAPGEYAEFTVYFNTTKVGEFVNYVIASSNETPNITANNTTKVINNTIPENHTNKTKKGNTTNNTITNHTPKKDSRNYYQSSRNFA